MSVFAIAQKPTEEGATKTAAFNRALSLDQKSEKTGEVTIKGQKVPYKVTASTQPVWDEEGKAIAGLFYVYYERTDVSNKENKTLGDFIQWWPRHSKCLDALGLYRT